MSKNITLGAVVFDANFQSCVLPDGRTVEFTRTEAALIRYLTRHPQTILTRNQLLDAVSGHGSDKLDRGIDFFINRIRKKLNDSARDPSFIATRYGEGYIWLPRAEREQPKAAGAHAVVGPLFGLDHIGAFTSDATDFADRFYRQFKKRFSSTLKVVLDAKCPPATMFGQDCPKIGIEITFVADKDELACVFRGTHFHSGKIFYVARHLILSPSTQPLSQDTLVQRVTEEVWTHLALLPESDMPLTVSMIDAGTKFSGIKGHWAENVETLRRTVVDNPDDHRAAVMLATNIHTKYLQDGVGIFTSGADPRQQDSDEIEALVTKSLPYLRDDPTFLAMAAKLLFFVDRGYDALALEIAEEANRVSTSPEATLPIVAQLRMFNGQSRSALATLNQCLERCEPGSQLEVYLLILKCEALAAIDDRTGVRLVLDNMYAHAPHIGPLMEVLFTDAEHPSEAAIAALADMPIQQARGTLIFLHHAYGRLLKIEEQRCNAYRTPITLFAGKFGYSVIPKEIAEIVPELCNVTN